MVSVVLRLRLAEYYLELFNKLIWNLDGNSWVEPGSHRFGPGDLEVRFSFPKKVSFYSDFTWDVLMCMLSSLPLVLEVSFQMGNFSVWM